jgi:hypothetical protein
MTIFERPYESLEELHETELEYFKQMFDCGAPIAVPAAQSYCTKHGLNPPPWLMMATGSMLCAHLRGDAPKERGRSSGIINRARRHAIDYVRWDVVIEVRERRACLRQEIKELRASSGEKALRILEERRKLLDWLVNKNYDVFECASRLLAKTPACGGRDAIKKSYQKVNENMRNPAMALHYHILDPQFLRSVGIDITRPFSPGKKIVPLYNLTG